MKFLTFVSILFVGSIATAQSLPAGKFQAMGSCHFDFEYGKVLPGRDPFIYGAGWSIPDVVIDLEIVNYAAGTTIQYAVVQPFESLTHEHVDVRDYPQMSYPYAGIRAPIQFGLKQNPADIARLFSRTLDLKAEYQLSIRADKIKLARYGTAGLGPNYFVRVKRNFVCDLTVIPADR